MSICGENRASEKNQQKTPRTMFLEFLKGNVGSVRNVANVKPGKIIHILFVSLLRNLQIKYFHFVIKCFSVDAQKFGGFTFIELCFFQHIQNQFIFGFGTRFF